MPIVKGGFTPGSHGRKQAASFGRRVQYLAADHDRDKAMLLNGKGEEITRGEALESFGGKDALYHEVIYAPSEAECRALEERFGGPEAAQQELARHLAGRLSPDRACLVAVHTHGDRWHLHMPIQGEVRSQLLGPKGEAQRAWDEVLRATRPRERIVDWEAHQRSEAFRGEMKEVQREQRQLDHERYQAIRGERNPVRKLEIAQDFDRQGLGLVVRRHQLELGCIQARYEARGRAGSWDHQVEIEKADQRRAGGENRIQRRAEQTQARVMGTDRGWEVGKGAARRTDRTLAQGREGALRATERTARALGRAITAGAELLAGDREADQDIRQMMRAALVLAQTGGELAVRAVWSATRVAWEVGREATPVAGRQAAHAAKVTGQMSVGAVLAIPSAGKSLVITGKESGRDAALAGKDLAQDGAKVGLTAARETGRAGAEVLQEGIQTAASLGVGALPLPMREAARGAIQAGKTSIQVAADLVRLDPLSAGVSLSKGGLELAASGARAMGEGARLPKVVRMPLQALEQAPIAGLAAKAARVAGEVTAKITQVSQERGFELER